MSQEAARQEARRIAQAAAAESCAALIGEVGALLRRFVVMTPAQARVVALWVLHTHLVDAAEATPYLAVTSAEKRSGKTRLLEVLELLVRAPWFTGRTTAAVLPRKIDADKPTLLLDESDAAFGGDKDYAEALRGVLNTGYRQGGKSTVCVGQGANISVQGLLDLLPEGDRRDRQAARHRRRPGGADPPRPPSPGRTGRPLPASRGRAPSRTVAAPHDRPRRRCGRTAPRRPPRTARRSSTTAPGTVSSRCWRSPSSAGGDHPVEARAACVELYGGRQVEDESTGIRAASDIRDVFGEHDRIATAALLDELHEAGRVALGRLVREATDDPGAGEAARPFDIKSRTIRIEGETPKGYLRASVRGRLEALPLARSGSENATAPQPAFQCGKRRIRIRHAGPCVADRKQPQTRSRSGMWRCGG